MKLGTLIEDPCMINFRLGPNSETPPGGRRLEFQYGRHIAHIFAYNFCLLYTSPSPRDRQKSRMPSSA